MSNYILLWVILIEGFVSIATEIITIRQLIPVVGNSVIVTSFIIGVFLLALAYGYKRGGRYTDNYIQILQKNFIIASALLGVGLSYSFIILFFNHFEAGILNNNMYVLITYLLVIIAPLIYLLGQTVPITMNLFNQELRVSEIGSKVLHLSTVGSFLGAVLTTVLFMNTFGVAWTVVANSLFLLLAVLFISKKRVLELHVMLPILIIAPLIYWFNIIVPKDTLIYTNAYSNYNIIDNFSTQDGRSGKVLSINHSASSFLANNDLSGFESVEKIKQIIFHDLQVRDKSILVLGAGGFSLSAANSYENRFVYVDIDPDLQKVVQKNFLNKINGEFVAADARTFLRTSSTKYHVIVSDTFGGKKSVPSHLLTREYFKLLEVHLDDSGVVVLNMIMRPTLTDAYSKKVDNTLRAAFNNCMSMPLNYSTAVSNVIYVCTKNSRDNIAEIYTDDLNRVSVDIAAINSGTTVNKSATNP